MVKKKIIIKLLDRGLIKSQDITKEEYEVFQDNKDLDYIVIKIRKDNIIYKRVEKKDISDEKLNLAYMYYLDKDINDLNKKIGCIYEFISGLVVLILIALVIVFFG